MPELQRVAREKGEGLGGWKGPWSEDWTVLRNCTRRGTSWEDIIRARARDLSSAMGNTGELGGWTAH